MPAGMPTAAPTAAPTPAPPSAQPTSAPIPASATVVATRRPPAPTGSNDGRGGRSMPRRGYQSRSAVRAPYRTTEIRSDAAISLTGSSGRGSLADVRARGLSERSSLARGTLPDQISFHRQLSATRWMPGWKIPVPQLGLVGMKTIARPSFVQPYAIVSGLFSQSLSPLIGMGLLSPSDLIGWP